MCQQNINVLMKKNLFIGVFLSLLVALASDAQSRKDGRVLINLTQSNGNDVKINYYQNPLLTGGMYRYKDTPPDSRLVALSDSGRYVKSITTAKFGTIVIHEKNIHDVQQMFTSIPSYALKKELGKYFKAGWVLSYYNKERGYAVFDKNPVVTKQEYVKLPVGKDKLPSAVSKYNEKGFYVMLVDYYDAVIQNGHGGNIVQKGTSFSCYSGDSELLNGLDQLTGEGWKISSASKYYNKVGDYDSYVVILDKVNEETEMGGQRILIAETDEDVQNFLSSAKANYIVQNMWCGWENRNYAREAEMAESYKPDWLGILSGITTGVSQLAGAGSSGSESYSGSTEGSYSSGAGSSGTSKSSKASGANHANWSSLERSYSGYESQLIRMSNSANIDKQEVRSIQRKMKEIREKIAKQSGGHQRAVSQWENWNP